MSEGAGASESICKEVNILRGKLSTNSTTVVMIPDVNGQWIDRTDKNAVEQAILDNNE
jgi:hypothetical protein